MSFVVMATTIHTWLRFGNDCGHAYRNNIVDLKQERNSVGVQHLVDPSIHPDLLQADFTTSSFAPVIDTRLFHLSVKSRLFKTDAVILLGQSPLLHCVWWI